MKKIVKDALVLFAITLVAGILLGVVYQITLDPIATSLTLSLEKSMSDEALISSSEGRASIVSKLSASARTAL